MTEQRRKKESRPDLPPRAAPLDHSHTSTGRVIENNHSTKGGKCQDRSEGFHMVGNAAIRQWLPVLGPNAWAVLSILNTYANHKDRLAWPSLDTLARYTGLNTTTVRASLVILEATGLIARIAYKDAAKHLRDNRLPKKRGRPPTIWLVRPPDRLPPVNQQRLDEAIERARAASNRHIGKYIAAFIQRAQVALDELPATVAQKTPPTEAEQPRADLPATVAQKYTGPPPQSQEPEGDFSATVAPNLPATVAHYSELPATVAGNSEPAGEEEPERGGDFPATVAGEQEEFIKKRSLIECTLSIQQQKQTDRARSEKRASQAPIPTVVVSSFSPPVKDKSLTKLWLERAGVQEPALSDILRGHPSLKAVIGWVVFAAKLDTLTRNPVGFVVTRLRANIPLPEGADRVAEALAGLTAEDLSVLSQVYALWRQSHPEITFLDLDTTFALLPQVLGQEGARRWLARVGRGALEAWAEVQEQVTAARKKSPVLTQIRLPWEDNSVPPFREEQTPWEKTWEQAKKALSSKLPRKDMITWIQDLSLMDVEEDEGALTIVLGVPNGFSKEWIQRHFNEIIQNTVANVMSLNPGGVHVEYAIQGEPPITRRFYPQHDNTRILTGYQ